MGESEVGVGLLFATSSGSVFSITLPIASARGEGGGGLHELCAAISGSASREGCRNSALVLKRPVRSPRPREHRRGDAGGVLNLGRNSVRAGAALFQRKEGFLITVFGMLVVIPMLAR